MKRLLINLFFLQLFLPGMTQGWITISGTVSDSLSGNPVPGHSVVIMSDSLNGGFVYYNEVFTDSAGYYRDEVPILADSNWLIYVQTLDCNFNLIRTFVAYNPVITAYTRDFVICTSNTVCQAWFSFYSDPQGSPDSFRFLDQSTGSIFSWLWSFGDGTYSQEQSPYHYFSGPGTYEVCLTVTGYNCTDTYCQTIQISDTVYQQVYGQVFAGNFPLQQGTVNIYFMNPSGGNILLDGDFPVDSNGIYYFTLVPPGNYLIQAVPPENSGYLPTYSGNVIYWQEAARLEIGIPSNPYNINLKASDSWSQGPGSAGGIINTGRIGFSGIDLINMILMDENLQGIEYTGVDTDGSFLFSSLDYGVYYIRADLAGVFSDNLKIEISPEYPEVRISLTFDGNSILGLEETSPGIVSTAVYPNPVSDALHISLEMSHETNLVVEIVSMTGQAVYHSDKSLSTGKQEISVSFANLPEGIYTLRLLDKEGNSLTQKVIRR